MATKVRETSGAFVSAHDAEREDLGDGISRQILAYGPDIMIVRVWFETGSVGSVHAHPHSQATYVESGRFETLIDGEKCKLGAGDASYIAPGLQHGVVCLEAGSLIDTFSPVREDFLGDAR